MKHACLKFHSDAEAARAFYGIMQWGKITFLRDESVIVPWPAVDWLRENKIPYTLVREMNQDDVVQALRSHLTQAV